MSERRSPEQDPEAIRVLEGHGLLRRENGELRTTRRWQGAMMRACVRLVARGEDGDDLRVPIACALLEHFGGDRSDREIAQLVDVMLLIEELGLGLTERVAFSRRRR